jgi:hypothetical protein
MQASRHSFSEEGTGAGRNFFPAFLQGIIYTYLTTFYGNSKAKSPSLVEASSLKRFDIFAFQRSLLFDYASEFNEGIQINNSHTKHYRVI